MEFKLIAFDMDGVIFNIHNFWMELHKVFDTYEKGVEYTQTYLHYDYATLVQKVVKELWLDKDATPYFQLINSVEYYKGVIETFKELKNQGYLIVTVITCGPSHLLDRLKKDLAAEGVEIDYSYANELVIENNKVKGEFLHPVAEGRKKKIKLLREICEKEKLSFKDVIGIGDGTSDIEMLVVSGKAIAFMPTSDKIRAIADVIIEKPDLREILKYV